MIHIQSGGVDSDLLFTADLPSEGQTLLVWCQGCGRGFTWTVPTAGNVPPHSCSKRCRDRNKNRKKRGEYLPCPTPAKRRYKTAQEAERAFQEHTKANGYGPQQYLCRCGVYHLGNVTWVVLEDNG